MGLLSLWLAVNVVGAHAQVSRPWLFNGPASLQGLIVFAGFYAGLQLDGKYRGLIKEYYLARIWRVWAPYMAALLGTMALYYFVARMDGIWIGAFERFSLLPRSPTTGSWIGIVFSQLSLIGTDLYFFLGFDPGAGSFYFSQHLWTEPFNAVNLLLLPQCGNIGIGIFCYALAPYLARMKSRALAQFVAAGIAIRFLFLLAGLPDDPWTNRCMPVELSTFALGMLSYRYYAEHKPAGQWWAPLALAVVALGLQAAGLTGLALRLPFFLGAALCLPWAYAFYSRLRFDYQLGQLSYPLYLVHYTLLYLGVALQRHGLWPHGFDAALLLCLIAAILFWKLACEPLRYELPSRLERAA